MARQSLEYGSRCQTLQSSHCQDFGDGNYFSSFEHLNEQRSMQGLESRASMTMPHRMLKEEENTMKVNMRLRPQSIVSEHERKSFTGPIWTGYPTSMRKGKVPMERKLQVYRRNPGDEEYKKDIITCILPECKRTENIQFLSEWLSFENVRIRQKLLEEIEIMLLQMAFKETLILDILQVIDNVMNFCCKKTNEADELLCLPVRVLTLCFIVLQVLKAETPSTSVYIQIQNISTRIHGEFNTIKQHPKSICSSFVATLLDMIDFFRQQSYHRGALDDILAHPRLEDIMQTIRSLNFSEKMVHVFVLLNMLFQQPVDKVSALIFTLVKSVLDGVNRKEKNKPFLHSLLFIVNKGIVLRIRKGPDEKVNWQDTSERLLACIKLYMGKRSKIKSQWRRVFLDSMFPLMFNTDRSVTLEILKLHEKSENKNITDLIFKHIQELMSEGQLRLFPSDDGTYIQSIPTWREIPGTIWHSENVTLYILLPTLKCLKSGSMQDYKANADIKSTKKHINSLETLALLQSDHSHPNLVELVGYQFRPLPLFYLIKSYKKLHGFLLEKRQNHEWLSNRQLSGMAIDSLDALLYLHSKGIVHRNLTTFSYSIDKSGKVMLDDFSLAKPLPSQRDRNSFVNDVNRDEIPVLYSAPESILDDKFDFKTDTWMMGWLIYGIFTHGGILIDSNLTFQELLEYIVFCDLKPTHWQCIPQPIFEAISNCLTTAPEKRADLEETRQTIQDFIAEDEGCGKRQSNRLSNIFELDKMYPPPVLKEPERTLPHTFVRLKQELDPRCVYFSDRSSRIQPSTCCITISELLPENPPQRVTEASFLSVEEVVDQYFIEEVLPQLSVDVCTRVLYMVECPTKLKNTGTNKFILHYKCREGRNIIDLAMGKGLGAPGVDSSDIFYLEIAYNLVKMVQQMHTRGWLLRDICGESIYVETDSRRVFMPRISRLRRQENDGVTDKVFEDRYRWLPTEVLQNGMYSTSSDIYMVGMTIWEMYTALDRGETCRLEGKPFSSIHKKDLLRELLAGTIPGLPLSCPIPLYNLLESCWNRNKIYRPTAQHLKNEIKAMLQCHSKRDLIGSKPKATQIKMSQQEHSLSKYQDESNPYIQMHARCKSSESITSTESKDIFLRAKYSNSNKQRKKHIPKPKLLHSPNFHSEHPQMRLTRGRKNMLYEPSGYYENDLDSEHSVTSRQESTMASLNTMGMENMESLRSIHQASCNVDSVIREDSGVFCDSTLKRSESIQQNISYRQTLSTDGPKEADITRPKGHPTPTETKTMEEDNGLQQPGDQLINNDETKGQQMPKLKIPAIPLRVKGQCISDVKKNPKAQKDSVETLPKAEQYGMKSLQSDPLAMSLDNVNHEPKRNTVSYETSKEEMSLRPKRNSMLFQGENDREETDFGELRPRLQRFGSCHLFTRNELKATSSCRISYI